MDMDRRLSSSPAITNILQNKQFENVKDPEFHLCFKQYSELCNSSLIAIICSKPRKKTTKTLYSTKIFCTPDH